MMQEGCRLDPQQVVLVGVSGGPDSLCLLDVLRRLGYALVVGHYNHGLRPEAQAEADMVERHATALGLPFTSGKGDVAEYAATYALSTEEAARAQRYRFLFEQARAIEAQAVAVGHTADDQVETILMHLLRGAGLSGLKGMEARSLPNAWSQEIPLVRPLLGVWREEVLAYTAEQNLKPALDQSNLDTRYTRNRYRHELIPYLEGYNPRLRAHILRMADILREDHAVLEALVDAAWGACLVEQGPGYVALDPRGLASQPLGVQRRLLRRAMQTLRPGLRDIDFTATADALEFLNSPTRSGERDLAAGLRLVLEPGQLWLAAWEADLPTGGWPQLPPGETLRLDVPGEAGLPGGWLFKARREAAGATGAGLEWPPEHTGPFQAWVRAESVQLPLQVRARRPGDRFCPLGMQGHSLKLSDLMVNLKLPRRARAGWPLVCSGDAIVWVPGFRLGHLYRLTGPEQEAIHLSLERDRAK